MSRLAPLSLVALLACPAASPPPTADRTKHGEAKKPPVAAPTGPTGPASPPGPAEAGPASGADASNDPAWFSLEKISHAKVVQPRNAAQIGPETATAMLLELDAGTTTEACIASVRTEMEKTLGPVADAVAGENGRLTLQGKADGYGYTVVCGPGKAGQPTMYLSYTR